MANMENNAQQGGNNAGSAEVKTSTQEEVNQIVQERLARERNKQNAGPDTEGKEKDLETREKDLAARERAFDIKEMLTRNKWPEHFKPFLEGVEDLGTAEQQLRDALNAYKSGEQPAYEPRSGTTEKQGVEDLRRAFGFYD